MSVLCPYCRQEANLVGANAVYKNRADLGMKLLWRCAPCDAHVGCHHGTTTPLGRLANRQLRAAKMKAHEAFDPIWLAKFKNGGISKKKARSEAYVWLAGKLGISADDCHIGMFDLDLCARVTDICSVKESAP